MILWQDLNFWTAVGQVGMGVLFGMAAGLILKRMMRLTRPSAFPAHSRICPACGTPSLQRVGGNSAQRALRFITRKWPYACARCHWPKVPQAPRAPREPRKMRFPFRKSTSATAQPAFLETLDVLEPAASVELAAGVELNPAAEPKLVTVPKPTVVPKPAAVPKPAVASKPAAPPKPAVEPKPATDEPKAADRPESAPVRVTPKDDATQIKESVYEYVALLNAGDVTARANCYLSEFTSFGIEGGPLISSRFERRTSGPISTFDLRCRDLRVYVHKDTAIATAYLIGTITNANGAPTRVTGRSSWVHLRQHGEWKIAHSHLSPLDPEA